MNYKIDKNIPIPEHNAKKPHIAAAVKMEVGESFLVEKEKVTGIRVTLYKLSRKIRVREVDDLVSRVWRVK